MWNMDLIITTTCMDVKEQKLALLFLVVDDKKTIKNTTKQ